MFSISMKRREVWLGLCLAGFVPRIAMAAETVAERVKKIVVEHLKVDARRVTPAASFKQLGADDLDVTELVMAIEESFNLAISDETKKKFRTVGDLTKYVEGAQKAKPALQMGPAGAPGGAVKTP
jgi:acyl carrier protein